MRENLFNGTSVNRPNKRVEVESVLHLFLISFLVWSHPCVKHRCFLPPNVKV